MGLPLPKMTLSAFLAWEAQQPERYEFHQGEAYLMVGGTARHNRVILNLASRLVAHLDGSPCQVFSEGMKVLADERVLYPDVMVACGKPDAGDEQIITDPKLIIEVLSPNTKGYDRRDKFILYRTLPSLQQYVLVDPVDRRVEVHTRAGDDSWTLVDQSKADELDLASVGLDMPISAVFKGVEAGSN